MTKKYAETIAISLAIAASVINVSHAASLAEIRQRGFLVAAVTDQASPFVAIDGARRTGFDPALLAQLQQALAVDIRVKAAPAASFGAMLQHGDADLVASAIEIAPDAQKSLAFSPPVAETTLYYLKRHDDDRINALNDLAERPLGIRRDSGSFLGLTELEHSLAKAENKSVGKITEYASIKQATDALEGKQIDVVIGSIAELAEAVEAQPGAYAIGQPVAHKAYVAWAVAADDADLAAYLKNFMLKERSGGELAALQQKWLSRKFDDLPETVVAQDWWTSRSDRPSEFPIPTPRDPD